MLKNTVAQKDANGRGARVAAVPAVMYSTLIDERYPLDATIYLLL